MPNINDPIVIVAATRTPIGNFNGVFKETPAPQLATSAITHALLQAKLMPEAIDSVILGCVLPAGLGQAPARQASLAAGIPTRTGCTTINKMCGSGMKAVMIAHDEILAGSHKVVLAGGMENMTRAPYLLPKARQGYRLGHGAVLDHMMLDGLEDAYNQGTSMGVFAEDCAEKYHFTREAQDDFAKRSLERAQKAAKNGLFKAEIAPVMITDRNGSQEITEDQGPQTVDAAKIPKLRPAFKKEGTVTAANASSISDGAAALILMRHSQAKAHGHPILATIIGHQSFAQEPKWFTTAPIAAIQHLLQRINWQANDVDLFEINEAFAVVTMAAIQELDLDADKVNIHGGACVLGHPIGASGARILVTLIHALKQQKLSKGIAALCIGGGEATAIAIEV